MASPVVVTRSTPSAVTTAGTSHTVNLPGSLVAGNRLEILFAVMAPTATPSATNWIHDTAFVTTVGTAQAVHRLFKISNGAEGATVTVTTTASTKSAHTAYQISGGGEGYGGTGATGTSGPNTANPPSVSVVGGPKDVLSIAVMAIEGEVFTGTGAPASYTNLLTANTGTGGAVTVNGMIQTAERAETAVSTVDPAVFSHTANDDWVAQTLVIPQQESIAFPRNDRKTVPMRVPEVSW